MGKYLHLILFFLFLLIRFGSTTEASPEGSGPGLNDVFDTCPQLVSFDDTETTIDDEDEIKVLKSTIFIFIVQRFYTGRLKIQTYNYCFSEKIYHYSDSSPPVLAV